MLPTPKDNMMQEDQILLVSKCGRPYFLLGQLSASWPCCWICYITSLSQRHHQTVKCLGSFGVVVALQLAWHPSSKLLQCAPHCFNTTFSRLCCLHQIWASRTFRKQWWGFFQQVVQGMQVGHWCGFEGLCAIDLQRWDKVLESWCFTNPFRFGTDLKLQELLTLILTSHYYHMPQTCSSLVIFLRLSHLVKLYHVWITTRSASNNDLYSMVLMFFGIKLCKELLIAN